MDNSNLSRYNRASQLHFLSQRQSGYEPWDTETDWLDSPQHDMKEAFGPTSPIMDLDLPRQISPLKHIKGHSSKFDDFSPKQNLVLSPPRRRQSSKSPYKVRRDDGISVSPPSNQRNASPLLKSVPAGRQVSPYKARREDDGRAVSPTSNQRIISPFLKPPPGRQVSPYKPGRRKQDTLNNDETVGLNRSNQRTSNRDERVNLSQFVHKEQKVDRISTRNTIHTQRERECEREREASHAKAPSVGELNEMVANIKVSRSPIYKAPNFESTESISAGDIFFSCEKTALGMQKNGFLQNDNSGINFYSRPTKFPHIDSVHLQRNKANGHGNGNGNIDHNPKRQSSSRLSSSENSKIRDASGISRSLKKFTANRRKKQADVWFSCMRKGPCKTSGSPDQKYSDEASFIEKALVVENLRQFWADKHQPGSLNGFTCHKQEAQLLSQLVSHDGIPHILFKGPPGSGKKALAMALVREIFGDSCWNKLLEADSFMSNSSSIEACECLVS